MAERNVSQGVADKRQEGGEEGRAGEKARAALRGHAGKGRMKAPNELEERAEQFAGGSREIEANSFAIRLVVDELLRCLLRFRPPRLLELELLREPFFFLRLRSLGGGAREHSLVPSWDAPAAAACAASMAKRAVR